MLNYPFITISRFFLISSLTLLLGIFANAQITTKILKKPSEFGKDTLFVVISNNEKIDIKRTIMGNTKKIVDKKILEFSKQM